MIASIKHNSIRMLEFENLDIIIYEYKSWYGNKSILAEVRNLDGSFKRRMPPSEICFEYEEQKDEFFKLLDVYRIIT